VRASNSDDATLPQVAQDARGRIGAHLEQGLHICCRDPIVGGEVREHSGLGALTVL